MLSFCQWTWSNYHFCCRCFSIHLFIRLFCQKPENWRKTNFVEFIMSVLVEQKWNKCKVFPFALQLTLVSLLYLSPFSFGMLDFIFESHKFCKQLVTQIRSNFCPSKCVCVCVCISVALYFLMGQTRKIYSHFSLIRSNWLFSHSVFVLKIHFRVDLFNFSHLFKWMWICMHNENCCNFIFNFEIFIWRAQSYKIKSFTKTTSLHGSNFFGKQEL